MKISTLTNISNLLPGEVLPWGYFQLLNLVPQQKPVSGCDNGKELQRKE